MAAATLTFDVKLTKFSHKQVFAGWNIFHKLPSLILNIFNNTDDYVQNDFERDLLLRGRMP